MLMKLPVILILLLSLSSATSLLDNVQPMLGAVIAIVVVVLAAAYMLAESINSQQLLAWTKSEVRELIVAGILFVIVMALFAANQVTVKTIAGTDDYNTAVHAAISSMNTTAVNAFYDIIKAYHAVNMRAGFSTNIVAGFYVWASVGSAPSSGYSSLMLFLNQAVGGLSNIIFVYNGIGVLLDFFMRVGGKLIFLAFAFRFIPFTRTLGNTLIALVIGAYVIFPLSLVLLSSFHTVITMPQPSISKEALDHMQFYLPAGASFICGEWYIRFLVATFGEIGFSLPPCLIVAIATLGAGWQACWEIFTRIVYPIVIQALIPIYWGLMLAKATYTTPDIATDFTNFLPFFRAIDNLIVISVVDVMIIGMVTYIGVKSINSMLGGEYLMPGIQRLI